MYCQMSSKTFTKSIAKHSPKTSKQHLQIASIMRSAEVAQKCSESLQMSAYNQIIDYIPKKTPFCVVLWTVIGISCILACIVQRGKLR